MNSIYMFPFNSLIGRTTFFTHWTSLLRLYIVLYPRSILHCPDRHFSWQDQINNWATSRDPPKRPDCNLSRQMSPQSVLDQKVSSPDTLLVDRVQKVWEECDGCFHREAHFSIWRKSPINLGVLQRIPLLIYKNFLLRRCFRRERGSPGSYGTLSPVISWCFGCFPQHLSCFMAHCSLDIRKEETKEHSTASRSCFASRTYEEGIIRGEGLMGSVHAIASCLYTVFDRLLKIPNHHVFGTLHSAEWYLISYLKSS
jgi:hypothetical protein